jgi:hypothetical protein
MIEQPLILQRYEFKYLIPTSFIQPICNFIQPYCFMDRYSEQEPNKFYTIHTLYLDNAEHKTYWDTEDGVPNRFKLRVRAYGQGSTGPIKFEIKRRTNEVISKTSVVVPTADWSGLLAEPIHEGCTDFRSTAVTALDTFRREVRLLQAGPKMLVKYERLAFRSRIDGYVRISFDRHICHQLKKDYELEGNTKQWFFNDDSNSMWKRGSEVVLELKFSQRAPVWVHDLVRKFGLVRGGYSKYGTAMRRALHGEKQGYNFLSMVPRNSAGWRMGL